MEFGQKLPTSLAPASGRHTQLLFQAQSLANIFKTGELDGLGTVFNGIGVEFVLDLIG